MVNSSMKTCFVALFVFLLVSETLIEETDAAGECGRTPIRSAAASLTPCLGAARNGRAKPPPICCSKLGALIRTAPRCLCAVLLSPLAKQAGIRPAIAISIPKRCNLRRPVGKKCGKHAYEQPNLHLILRDCDQVFEAIINTGRWGMTV
ncbi:hypothetical protein CUMW_136880 [Citrus unshiu]|uniref:Bifunctional inhibitor/plant lipid transfer protein/seed storage helical domain-containing protein n=1 Tax=Citrus unshiu TaxID=55188 RepID=A0A2H5PI49_CITUN|nr:hypothetical protein CUMW_136880 [Citrus unshiu]